MRWIVTVVLCALMGACGGGEWADEEKPGTQPVNCKTAPERCR